MRNTTIYITTKFDHRTVRLDVNDKGNTLWSYTGDPKECQDISDADVIKIVRMVKDDRETAVRIIKNLGLI